MQNLQLTIIIIFIAILSNILSAQTVLSQINETENDLFYIEQDCIDYAKNLKNENAQVALNFSYICRQNINYLKLYKQTYLIYMNLSNESDRNVAINYLIQSTSLLKNMIDDSIEKVNIGQSFTQKNNLISAGTQIKNELRELAKLLNKI